MILSRLFSKHTSLLLIIIGAIALFATNIFLKDVLNPAAYGEYSIYITFFQLLSSFGLLGFEQVFLRVSIIKEKNQIQTDKNLFIVLILTWVLFGGLSAFLFRTYFSNINLNYFYFFIGTLSVTFSMFVYNAFRLNANFVFSQLMYNTWKLLLFVLGLVFLLNNFNDINRFIETLTYLLGIFLFLQGALTYKKLHFSFIKKESFKKLGLYAFHFFISLLTLTLIGYVDRFIIKGNFGAEALGDYFFLATIFFFPYTLIQNYVGFKELVAFKKDASAVFLNKKLLNITLIGVFMGGLIIALALILNATELFPYIGVKENFVLIILFVLTGIVKLSYSLFSALLGARGEVKTIKNANLQSLIFIVLIGGVLYPFFDSMEIVALAFLLFWVSRAFIWQYNLKKQFNPYKK